MEIDVIEGSRNDKDKGRALRVWMNIFLIFVASNNFQVCIIVSLQLAAINGILVKIIVNAEDVDDGTILKRFPRRGKYGIEVNTIEDSSEFVLPSDVRAVAVKPLWKVIV